jgi:hypothetical protein
MKEIFTTRGKPMVRYRHAVLIQHVNALFVWLISHQPAVLFSQNKPATNSQPAVLFTQNKSAPAISHQPNEHADNLDLFGMQNFGNIWAGQPVRPAGGWC